MKITIPATSAILGSLFSAGQITQLKTGKDNKTKFNIEIQNKLGSVAFYIEKGATAVVGESGIVQNGQNVNIELKNLNDYQVISASGNLDVMVLQL